MDKIQFFYNPMSRARMVAWGLEEVAVPYETLLIDFKKGDDKKPEFLKLNPMGKVPTILHRGVVVTETAAILTYLGDLYPKKNLAPSIDDPLRGSYLRWLFFVAACFEAAVLENAYPRVNPLPPSTLGWGSYKSVLDTVEQALSSGPFLLGDLFSMADIYLASQLSWGMQFGTVEKRSTFQRYVELCEARPAAVRARAMGESMMEKLQRS